MTSNKVVFSSMDNNVESKVNLRNDNNVIFNGKSVVIAYARNTEIIKLNEFHYVIGMKCNLLSVGQLMEKN